MLTADSPLATATTTVVDIGLGNVGSVVNMLRRAGSPSTVATTADDIAAAHRLVLPGVGRWDTAIAALDTGGIRQALHHAANERGTPILGICLGMQLLMEASEEGPGRGLGLIPGRIQRFQPASDGLGRPLKVPHMGWNLVRGQADDDPLAASLVEDSRFYFVHSYHATDVPDQHVLMTANYGTEFVCGVRRENVRGVQFHPEKSHRFGLRLMEAFATSGAMC